MKLGTAAENGSGNVDLSVSGRISRSSCWIGLRIPRAAAWRSGSEYSRRWAIQPSFNERPNMSRKFLPTVCTSFLCILSKSEQDWHTYKNIPRGVVLRAEPGNVTLDWFADPGCSDSVDRSRTDEIAVQQENLLS